MGKRDAPEPTNPLPTLALQQAFNTPNQYTPFGNLIYQGPSLPSNVTSNNFGDVPLSQIGQSSIYLDLPQNLQAIYDTQTGITQESLNQAWAALQQLGATNYQLPEAVDPTQYEDFRQGATDSEFDRLMGLLDPVYDRREQQLRESLASRGIPMERAEGTEMTHLSQAASRELDLLDEQRSRATENAALQAINIGRDEGRDLMAFNQSALQQEMARQAFLQNLVAGPLGYQQVQAPTLQNFYAPSQVDAVGAFGAYDQANQSAFSSQMDLMASIYGGLGTLGGAWIGRGG